MTPNVPTNRTSRYDGALLAAFIAGASLDGAAKAAGCSRKTAGRRKAALQPELDAARAQLVGRTLAIMEEALPAAAMGAASVARELSAAAPAAARHLAAVAAAPDADPGVVTRASVELLSAAKGMFDLVFTHHLKMAERGELGKRIDAIEAALAARGSPVPGRRPLPFPPNPSHAVNAGAVQ